MPPLYTLLLTSYLFVNNIYFFKEKNHSKSDYLTNLVFKPRVIVFIDIILHTGMGMDIYFLNCIRTYTFGTVAHANLALRSYNNKRSNIIQQQKHEGASQKYIYSVHLEKRKIKYTEEI